MERVAAVMGLLAVSAAIVLWPRTTRVFPEFSARPVAVPQTASRPDLPPSHFTLPAALERNMGQANSRFKFISHSGSSTLALASSEAILVASSADWQPPRRLRMRILRANPEGGPWDLSNFPAQ